MQQQDEDEDEEEGFDTTIISLNMPLWSLCTKCLQRDANGGGGCL